jgi:preprotein translocase subunit SecY
VRMLWSKRPAEEVPSHACHRRPPNAHGLLTTMLALGYAILVIFLAAQLSIVGGGSGLAVSIATLVVAALLWPAWHRIQRAVNRRFNRRRVQTG